jgi:hypothetical protein
LFVVKLLCLTSKTQRTLFGAPVQPKASENSNLREDKEWKGKERRSDAIADRHALTVLER